MTAPAARTSSNIAPQPKTEAEATTEAWLRHYAVRAQSLYAAYRVTMDAFFKSPTGSEEYHRLGRQMGTQVESALAHQMVAYLLATTAALPGADERAQGIWDLTPELGALNGEWEDQLAGLLGGLGIDWDGISPDPSDVPAVERDGGSGRG